ncbi:MAG: hypothetical protein QW618_03865, partial [Nitrososphaerales archaeon]
SLDGIGGFKMDLTDLVETSIFNGKLVYRCKICKCGWWGEWSSVENHFKLLGTDKDLHLFLYSKFLEECQKL